MTFLRWLTDHRPVTRQEHDELKRDMDRRLQTAERRIAAYRMALETARRRELRI